MIEQQHRRTKKNQRKDGDSYYDFGCCDGDYCFDDGVSDDDEDDEVGDCCCDGESCDDECDSYCYYYDLTVQFVDVVAVTAASVVVAGYFVEVASCL